MDLGLTGKKAIVCASSKGLGKGCAMALAGEGVDLVISARGRDRLEATAAELRGKYGVAVTPIVGDVTTPECRARILAACPAPDILITNAGGPPPGDFRDWTRETWIKALDANMLTPIELIKATVDGMIERRFGRIVNITSSAVKAPIEILGLSNGARLGLTGFVAGIARKTVKYNVTINNLLPGLINTDRTTSNIEAMAKNWKVSFDEAMARRLAALPAERLGTVEEFRDACAFLCAASSSYITGQNLLIDGGTYPGTF